MEWQILERLAEMLLSAWNLFEILDWLFGTGKPSQSQPDAERWES